MSPVNNISIPNSVTTIGDYAFQNDTSITSVTMSNNVTFIGQGAFNGCTNLATITLSGVLPNPFSIQSGSTTYAQYWGIPNTTTINYTAICFLEDTKILCLIDDEEIYVPIQDIKVGNIVKTYLHGPKVVTFLGKDIIYNSGDNVRIKDRLYRYSKEDFSDLTEDLIITGGHSSLVNDLTDEQKRGTDKFWKIYHKIDDKYRLLSCVNEKTIPYEEKGTFNIYHLTLDNEDILGNYGIYANGLLVESCCKKHLLNKKHMCICS